MPAWLRGQVGDHLPRLIRRFRKKADVVWSAIRCMAQTRIKERVLATKTAPCRVPAARNARLVTRVFRHPQNARAHIPSGVIRDDPVRRDECTAGCGAVSDDDRVIALPHACDPRLELHRNHTWNSRSSLRKEIMRNAEDAQAVA